MLPFPSSRGQSTFTAPPRALGQPSGPRSRSAGAIKGFAVETSPPRVCESKRGVDRMYPCPGVLRSLWDRQWYALFVQWTCLMSPPNIPNHPWDIKTKHSLMAWPCQRHSPITGPCMGHVVSRQPSLRWQGHRPSLSFVLFFGVSTALYQK